MSRATVIGLLALLPFVAATQQDYSHLVPEGYLTGQKFLDLDTNERLWATTGAIDGLLGSTQFGAPLAQVMKLKDCVTHRNNGQTTAMVEKFIRDRPEQWHIPFVVLVSDAMATGCRYTLHEK